MTIDVTDESPYQVWGRPLRVALGARAATMGRRTPVPTRRSTNGACPCFSRPYDDSAFPKNDRRVT